MINREKILNLLESSSIEDVAIGLGLLLRNYTKKEVIKLFNNYGHKIDYPAGDSALSYKILEAKVGNLGDFWKYFYYKDIGIFVSECQIQLHNHPATHSKNWDPQEL